MEFLIIILIVVLIVLIIPIANVARISNKNIKLMDEYINERDKLPSWLSNENKAQEFLDGVFEFIDTSNAKDHHKDGIKRIVNEENTMKKLLLDMRELEKQGKSFEYQQIIMNHKLINLYWHRRQKEKRLPSWIGNEEKKQEFLNGVYKIVESMNTDVTDSMKMDMAEVRRIMIDDYNRLILAAGHSEDFGSTFEEQQNSSAETVESIYGETHGFFR